jgi:hypothetical protein
MLGKNVTTHPCHVRNKMLQQTHIMLGTKCYNTPMSQLGKRCYNSPMLNAIILCSSKVSSINPCQCIHVKEKTIKNKRPSCTYVRVTFALANGPNCDQSGQAEMHMAASKHASNADGSSCANSSRLNGQHAHMDVRHVETVTLYDFG